MSNKTCPFCGTLNSEVDFHCINKECGKDIPSLSLEVEDKIINNSESGTLGFAWGGFLIVCFYLSGLFSITSFLFWDFPSQPIPSCSNLYL